MEEITKNLKTEKLLLGTKSTLKALRKSTISKVFLASNCPDYIAEDVQHFCTLENVEVETLNISCDDLGIVCKKPFLVSVVGILK
jgi:large subunit ribosomal protein L30e